MFNHIATFETDLSDRHKLILTFFKPYFRKRPPKNIEYINYKNVNENNLVREKLVRGNKELFMTKELSKAIVKKSKLKNICSKWSSRENFLAIKKQKNICKNLSKNTKKN